MGSVELTAYPWSETSEIRTMPPAFYMAYRVCVYDAIDDVFMDHISDDTRIMGEGHDRVAVSHPVAHLFCRGLEAELMRYLRWVSRTSTLSNRYSLYWGCAPTHRQISEIERLTRGSVEIRLHTRPNQWMGEDLWVAAPPHKLSKATDVVLF